MALVTYKDLCVDASDVSAIEGFWSNTLGLDLETFAGGDSVLRGPTAQHTVWVNLVPEAKQVKNRVHLDVWATSLRPFAALEQLSDDDTLGWTVFADPEGNEFCVFVDDREREHRLKDIGVDAVDAPAIAAWWADAFGGTLGHDDGYSYVDDIAGAPVESFDFPSVPEPKTVKNRIHWDVTLTPGSTVADLVAHGAVVLAEPDEENRWTVMADPEGNEFCVFDVVQ